MEKKKKLLCTRITVAISSVVNLLMQVACYALKNSAAYTECEFYLRASENLGVDGLTLPAEIFMWCSDILDKLICFYSLCRLWLQEEI